MAGRDDEEESSPAKTWRAEWPIGESIEPVSPRLVREEVRLQSEAGPLLWLCLREQEYRDGSAAFRTRVIEAIRAVDPVAARAATIAQATAALDWLVDEKVRLEATAGHTGQGRR